MHYLQENKYCTYARIVWVHIERTGEGNTYHLMYLNIIISGYM